MSQTDGPEQAPTDEDDDEFGVETPEADAIEQHTALRGETPASWPRHVPFDANEADAADQQRPVELDEDDYR